MSICDIRVVVSISAATDPVTTIAWLAAAGVDDDSDVVARAAEAGGAPASLASFILCSFITFTLTLMQVDIPCISFHCHCCAGWPLPVLHGRYRI